MISPVESKIKIGYCIKIFKIYSKSIETRSKYFLFPSKNLKNSINIVQYWTIIFVFKYPTNNFKTSTKKKEKKSKRIPLSACIRLIDTKENVQGVAKKTERRLHRRKGISLVFALLPFPHPSFFHLFSLSLPPHRLLFPPILHELRSIFVQSVDIHAPSSPYIPLCPPLSLDHGYRLGSDNLTIACCYPPPANLLRIFNCIPTWNGREKTSLAFHPLPSAPHCSPFFLFREDSYVPPPPLLSFISLPRAIWLEHTWRWWWKILKIGHSWARCSPLISTFYRHVIAYG